MQKFVLGVIVLLTICFMGCPMQTKKSIDGGSYKIPEWLLGKWVDQADTSANPIVCRIKHDGKKTGHAIVEVLDSAGKGAESSALIFSTVGDNIFVSAFEDSNDEYDAGYYLYKFNKKSEKEIELIPLKEEIVDAKITQDSLKSWLLHNMNDSTIYDYSDISKYSKMGKK